MTGTAARARTPVARVGKRAGKSRAEAAIGTAAVLAIHLALRPLVQRIDARMKTAVQVETYYRLRVLCQGQEATLVRTVLLRHVNSHPAMTVQGLTTQDAEEPGRTVVVADVYSHERNDRYLDELMARLSIEPCIASVRWERVR